MLFEDVDQKFGDMVAKASRVRSLAEFDNHVAAVASRWMSPEGTRRYDTGKPIVLRTNKAFSEWGEVFPHAACVVTLEFLP